MVYVCIHDEKVPQPQMTLFLVFVCFMFVLLPFIFSWFVQYSLIFVFVVVLFLYLSSMQLLFLI